MLWEHKCNVFGYKLIMQLLAKHALGTLLTSKDIFRMYMYQKGMNISECKSIERLAFTPHIKAHEYRLVST